MRRSEAVDALATAGPLVALQAHAVLLNGAAGGGEARALRRVVAEGDRLAQALALRPLARASGAAFDPGLVAHASGDDPLLAEQALWALAERPPSCPAVAAVVAAVAGGGHRAVIGQLALEAWGPAAPLVAETVSSALARHEDAGSRVRLFEAASVTGRLDELLAATLRSASEPAAVRAAGARALAARPDTTLLDHLWRAGDSGDGELRLACARALLALGSARGRAAAAALAAAGVGSCDPYDRLLESIVRGRSVAPSRAPGLRVAQVFLQGRLDGELANAGAGDGGGISTLLVHLGRALGAEHGISRVTTIARALAEPDTGFRHARLSDLGSNGVSIERIPFGPAGYVPTNGLWEHRLELERAFEQVIVELAGVDVVHLRFADAGAFTAARVCRRLGIPTVFTAAPDPHGVIAAAERCGELDRSSFPEAELREHYLLRAELVGRLLIQAKAVAVLPRPRAREALRVLIGVPFARVQKRRVHTVAEGISLAEIEHAAREHARGVRSPAVDSLVEDVRALPQERHGLPLLLSVGRLHRVKGFPLLLEAWAGDAELYRAFNLVIVGGGLEQPTPEELYVLAALEEAGARFPHASEGLVLLGHRSNREVAMLLRAARSGLAPLVAPGGVYACASEKEEFGVALLEAMATGLALVAPDAGGPATYVHEGRTGHTADTSSLESVRCALHRAAASRTDDARAARAARLVRARYTIESMATSLARIYVETAGRAEQVAA